MSRQPDVSGVYRRTPGNLDGGIGIDNLEYTVSIPESLPDALARHKVLGKGVDGTSEDRLRIASGILRFDLPDASTGAVASAWTTSSYAGLIGGWQHLAVTCDGRATRRRPTASRSTSMAWQCR